MEQSTDLTPVPSSPAGIQSLSPDAREAGVTRYLSDARDRLALALRETGPESVASIRAELSTVQEMTRQLGLSKEIQNDAAEMVRRSEYALGKAIRAGQEAGVVRTRGGKRGVHVPGVRGSISQTSATKVCDIASATDFATNAMLYGDERGDKTNGIYAMADGVGENEFEEALTAAREEGNVSRANVVRKIREIKSGEVCSETAEATAMWRRVRDLAANGYSVQEVREITGYEGTENALRTAAASRGIRFVNHKTRLKVISSQAEFFERGLLSIETGINNITELVDLKNVRHDDKAEALERLTEARNTINAVIRNIKKEIDK